MRQCAAGLLGLGLAACGGPAVPMGSEGYVQGFLGGAVADEPRAALVARDILSAGGTAADAAVALYFALGVTLPSRAALGGGGVCLVHDAARGRVEALDFMAARPQAIPAGADRPSAVPAALRGLFALHARYGRLRWEQLVAPAENMARFGVPVSRALAADLALVGAPLLADVESRKVFAAADGRPLGEGARLTQIELAAVLGQIRTRGPGEFYLGPFARQFVAGVREAGGSLGVEDLSAVKPLWRETVAEKSGNLTIHFAPPPAAGGVIAAQVWEAIVAGRYARAAPDLKAQLVAEAALRAFADMGRWRSPEGGVLAEPARGAALMAGASGERATDPATLGPSGAALMPNPASTGFAVVDPFGAAVACGLSLNNLFGTGRVVPGTGILLAAAPGVGQFGPALLGPVLVVNPHVRELFLAGAAGGGAAGPTAMVQTLADVLLGGQGLAAALRAPRIHRGIDGALDHEPGVAPEVLEGLRRRGHVLRPASELGRVNAIHCAGGAPVAPETCSFLADPRAFGLGVGRES